MNLKRTSIILLYLFMASHALYSQIQLKTEYIGTSHYRDVDNKKTEGKGNARVYSAAFQLPLSMKQHTDGRITAFVVSLSGSYTELRNTNLSRQLCPHEISNARIGFTYVMPFKEKWSVMGSLGAGVYAAHHKLSDITMNEVLFDGAALFIWHARSNLDLGFGLAINSSFGYPMGFPAFYLNWKLGGRYEVDVQLMDAVAVSGGIKLTDYFKLSIVSEISGSLALEKIGGEKMMFSHSYIVAGLQPQFNIGKYITIPVTLGITAERAAFYEKRSLKAFFKSMNREYDPYFQIAPYVSAAFRVGF